VCYRVRTTKERKANELRPTSGHPLRYRAEPARRAGDGHLLPAPEGQDHLPRDAINLYINSPGGSVTAGLAIYDTVQFVKPDIVTTALGMAASMGAFLLAAGAKGKRNALPNTRILLHQPSVGGLAGQASDVEIHAKELIMTKRRLNEILAANTGQPYERIERDTDRDYIMGPDEAIEYGVIDNIITNH
jgi:ATP-dependent Clp protease protease subunit